MIACGCATLGLLAEKYARLSADAHLSAIGNAACERCFETASRAKFRKSEEAGERRVRQSCVAVNWVGSTDRVLCFDESNAALVGIDYPQNDRDAPPPISRIEFGGFQSVGGKLVPFDVRAFKDGQTIATMKILETTELKDVDPAFFTPPSDAVLWPQCEDMQVAEPSERVQPNYSPATRMIAPRRLILYAVVEENGSLSHVTVIQAARPDMNTAALEAFRRWRYKPAKCGQTPIRAETSMYFDFWRD